LAPRSTLNSALLTDPKSVFCIGMPMYRGQQQKGVSHGPAAIRNNGLAERIERDGWLFHDFGDLNLPDSEEAMEEHPHAKHSELVGRQARLLCESISKPAQEGKFCLTLGGDHSLAIGSIAGVLSANPETAVIWVDAHADINTPKTTYSGNVHGMAAAFLLGLHDTRQIRGFDWMKSIKLLPQRLVYVGLRDVDPPERDIIRDLGIKAFTMQDVDRYGVGKTMEMALDHLLQRVNRRLHLTLDIDAVDPAYAPSTGTTVRGGLLYREAFYICESIAETGLLTSMDMVEVNPELSSTADSKMTAEMAVGLICAGLGNRIL